MVSCILISPFTSSSPRCLGSCGTSFKKSPQSWSSQTPHPLGCLALPLWCHCVTRWIFPSSSHPSARLTWATTIRGISTVPAQWAPTTHSSLRRHWWSTSTLAQTRTSTCLEKPRCLASGQFAVEHKLPSQAPSPFPTGILQPVFWPFRAWEGRLCSWIITAHTSGSKSPGASETQGQGPQPSLPCCHGGVWTQSLLSHSCIPRLAFPPERVLPPPT